MRNGKELKQYIQNQIVHAKQRLDGYARDINGNRLLQRSVFLVLDKYVRNFISKGTDPRIIVMPGLRGTGKTTLLAQLYISLKAKKLYLSVDEIIKRFDADMWKVMDNYEELVGQSLETLKEPLFLFLDEIHYDSKWAAFLKTMYDKSKKIFVLCTGSAALLLREQVGADLARRVKFEDIHPVNFPEYRMIKDKVFPIKGLGKEIRDAFLQSDDAKGLYSSLNVLSQKVNNYWIEIDRFETRNFIKFGTLPFTLMSQNDALTFEYIGQMMEKITCFDLVWHAKFDVETLNKVEKILYLISDSIAVSLNNLSDAVEMKKDTLALVLSALVRAGVLIRVMPHGSHYSQVRKPSKYLFASPALRYFFLSSLDSTRAFEHYQGSLFEDLVAMYFQRILPKFGSFSLTYDVSQGGADFIVTTPEKKIVIEVGSGNKGIKQVLYTLKQKKCTYGVIFHSGDLIFDNELNIVKVPWKYFLLM